MKHTLIILLILSFNPILAMAGSGVGTEPKELCLLDLQAYFSENMHIAHSDIQGDTFVGGDALLKHFTINGRLKVGGHLLASDGTITGEAAAGSARTNRVGKAGRIKTGGNFYQQNDMYQKQLASLSEQLKSLPSNLSPRIVSGTIKISANDEFNVVTISAYDLQRAHKLVLKGTSNSTMVINVDNENLERAEFFRMSLELEGVRAENVIYNFYNSEKLLLGMVGPVQRKYGTGIQGTLIAPYASVKFFMGVIDGGLYAKTLEDGIPTGQVDPLKVRSLRLRSIVCKQ